MFYRNKKSNTCEVTCIGEQEIRVSAICHGKLDNALVCRIGFDDVVKQPRLIKTTKGRSVNRYWQELLVQAVLFSFMDSVKSRISLEGQRGMRHSRSAHNAAT